ncbi:hypothetical protein FJQ98_08020 [Lysinibacillus agricola]|uniref:Uncharacterized protein n=1 Tax=Lysinibacillus agricola TaxID=2590012 RepID=A0ABX7AVG3_9BACI|nr:MULTISPECIES: hypothetical protein [Lysinibacillus]QQP13966.1 hypothetical protein FJQ98_08020 [Lysinibacillus agricola]
MFSVRKRSANVATATTKAAHRKAPSRNGNQPPVMAMSFYCLTKELFRSKAGMLIYFTI